MPALTRNQQAPDFEMPDMTGKLIKLSDYRNEKLLLCFFRYAACPWCNLALHRLVLQMPRFDELGLKVVAFIQSEPANIKRYIYDRHTPLPTFPIIADPQRKIYDLYHISDSLKPLKTIATTKSIPSWLQSTLGHGFTQGKIDGSASLVPAHFLIGPYDLTIYKARYGEDYFNDLPMIEILEFAQFGAD